jgi:tetratricopeptide (TPR) repeat protein
MNSIIKFSCAKSEQEKILKIDELRFESIMQIFQECIDEELKVLDYYALCDKPNLQHKFLAKMTEVNHLIITTNFDNLIEHALLQQGLYKKNIISVITREDFIHYSRINGYLQKGKRVIIKIHGSTKNIITEMVTKDTLVATIRALGLGKPGENVFQIENFKKSLIENAVRNRSLIIIGYSGSDDFDIIPTLKVLKKLNDIFWINHINIDVPQMKIQKIDYDYKRNRRTQYKIDRILLDLYHSSSAKNIYRIDVNTTKLIEHLMKNESELNQDHFSITPEEYLTEYLKKPNEIMQYFISYMIFYRYNKYKDAKRCTLKVLELSEMHKNEDIKIKILNCIGLALFQEGRFAKAIEKYNQALSLSRKKNNKYEIAKSILNIGQLYKSQGLFLKALDQFQLAMITIKDLDDDDLISNTLYKIGQLHFEMENYEKAYDFLKQSLDYTIKNGDLDGRAHCLNDIGLVYCGTKKYDEAIDYFNKALEIYLGLSNKSEEATQYNNLAIIYHKKGQSKKAFKYIKKSIEILKILNIRAGIETHYNNIAGFYASEKNYEESLKWHKKAISVEKQLGNLIGLAGSYINIASNFIDQKKYSDAIIEYKKALEILNEENHISHKIACFTNMGISYSFQKKYSEAKKYYSKALKLLNNKNKNSKENLIQRSQCLHGLGENYESQGNYDYALSHYFRSIEILDKIGDLEEIVTIRNNICNVYIEQKRFEEALNLNLDSKEIINESNKLYLFADYYKKRGDILFNIGDFQNSLENYLKAIEYGKKYGVFQEKISCYNNIAGIKFIEGKISETKQILIKALRISKREGDLTQQLEIHKNFGDFLIKSNDLRGALQMYQKALKIANYLEISDSDKYKYLTTEIDKIKKQVMRK